MSIKKRKGLPPWAMQGHKSIGRHVWDHCREWCVKCKRPRDVLWCAHWNPRIHKTDACVRPSKPTTVTLKQLKRILGGAR